MKKLVAIILMLLFAANVGGFSLTHHACGKKFQYLVLGGKKKHSSCCCKGEAADRGCCKTKVIKVKVDDGKSFAKHIVLNPQPIIADVLPQPVRIPTEPTVATAHALIIPRIHPPPLLLSVRKHVLHGVFLI